MKPSYPPSKPQRELYKIVKKHYPDTKLDYYVDTLEGYRWIDIAIPSLMVGIEYNGYKYHKGKVKRKADKVRKIELESIGWYIITVTRKNVLKFICDMSQYVEDEVVLPKQ